MCCISKEKKTKTAETDIHVIKVMQKKAKGYRTPFTHHYIKKNIMSGEFPLVAACDGFHFKGNLLGKISFWDSFIYKCIDENAEKLYVYGKDFVHTFPSDAKLKEIKSKGLEVFDCIIPAGAEYIEGECVSLGPKGIAIKQKTYASSQIYFVGKHQD